VMVMYLGRVAEIGPADTVLGAPSHPYTGALLSSMPSLDPDRRTEVAPLAGDPPNPIDPPTGCRFHPRCALAEPVCAAEEPPLASLADDHRVACLARQPGSGHSLAPASERIAA
jgi:peptide/nickel transport system ATP-binding protein